MAKEVIEAPIAGKVLRVLVKEGSQVKEGDAVCVLESMKMENSILAPVSGKVNEIKAVAGKFVKAGETLAVVEY